MPVQSHQRREALPSVPEGSYFRQLARMDKREPWNDIDELSQGNQRAGVIYSDSDVRVARESQTMRVRFAANSVLTSKLPATGKYSQRQVPTQL